MDDATACQRLAERRAFIVPGVMKSGTCSLRSQLQWLGEDELYLPHQELHFFDEKREFEKGPAYYYSWFDWGENWQPDLVGDITPSYLYIPEAMHRIAQLLPHAKLIVLLRNPIGRAVSHHNHDLSKGRDVGTLEDRWQLELSKPFAPSRKDAFSRGFYAEQLKRVLEYFPRSQVLVTISERFRTAPRQELQRIGAFLGLSKSAYKLPDKAFVEQHVRKVYAATLPQFSIFRRSLQHFYAMDVEELRSLIADEIVEWEQDFPRGAVPSLLSLPLKSISRKAPPKTDNENGIDEVTSVTSLQLKRVRT